MTKETSHAQLIKDYFCLNQVAVVDAFGESGVHRM